MQNIKHVNPKRPTKILDSYYCVLCVLCVLCLPVSFPSTLLNISCAITLEPTCARFKGIDRIEHRVHVFIVDLLE